MTDADIRDIELDYEAVRMSQGWDVGEHVLLELPDDPQKCVDAVPRLLAEVKRLKAIVNELEGHMTDPGGCGVTHV